MEYVPSNYAVERLCLIIFMQGPQAVRQVTMHSIICARTSAMHICCEQLATYKIIK